MNHYRTIPNSLFNESIRHGRHDVNPVRAVHQFREPPGRARFPGDIVRKITGHRSRELERCQ